MLHHPLVQLLIASVRTWSDHRASSKGAALAFYMIFSLAPMLVLVIAVAGFFFGQEAVRTELLDQLGDLTGQQGAEAIQTVLASVQQSDGGLIAALVSVGILLVGSTTAFAELKNSLDEIWDVPRTDTEGLWSLVLGRLLSFGLVMVLALFLLMSLAVNALLAVLQGYWGRLWSESAYATAASLVSSAFSVLVVVALFAVVLRLLPAVRLKWRDVIPGAVLTTALFLIGKSLIGLYLGQGAVASAYGAAGSVVALFLWIYYSSLIFFFGAAFTREYAERHGSQQGVLPIPVSPAPTGVMRRNP
jgi:membrane protein